MLRGSIVTSELNITAHLTCTVSHAYHKESYSAKDILGNWQSNPIDSISKPMHMVDRFTKRHFVGALLFLSWSPHSRPNVQELSQVYISPGPVICFSKRPHSGLFRVSDLEQVGLGLEDESQETESTASGLLQAIRRRLSLTG